MKLRLIALLATLPLFAACTPHTTQATEVGVRFNKITQSTETSDPGATYFFAPIINDWATYDTSTQNLVMSAKATEGDRKEKDDLRFKTRDGNDIETAVTVRWPLDPTRAAYSCPTAPPT